MSRLDEIKKYRIDIARAAAARWEETKERRADQLTAIAKMGPAGAESVARSRSYFARETQRAELQRREIAIRLPVGAERQIGNTFDIRNYPSGDAAERAGLPVARLIDTPHPGYLTQGFATGFMVSPRLLITNNHVFPDKASAKAVAHFDYEYDTGGLRTGVMFDLEPDLLFVTDVALDYSLVAVSSRAYDGQVLQQFAYAPLIAATGKILQGQPISIIQYPLGGAKQWAETENRLLFLEDPSAYLQYTTDTLPGSSGSPAFNSFWEVVGLHHSGVPRMEGGKIMTKHNQVWDEKTMSDEDIDWVANEGIRASSLVANLKALKLREPNAQALLDELLHLTTDPLTKSIVLPQGENFMPTNLQSGGASMQITVNGTANFNFLAPPAAATLPPLPEKTATAPEKTLRFDPDYKHRAGYNPNFLDGVMVPPPSVRAARASEILLESTGVPWELNYHHFSVVMNKSRRLMMWSAVNVNYGEDKRPISGRDAFGTDKWKPDPRIPIEYQLEDVEFYAPAKKFDRGHIVRREDNAWGDSPLLTEFANADTFHWTNCTPQHEAFNRSSEGGLWGKLENHVTEQADSVGQKLVIFAGPVLDPSDLEHDFGAGEVKIPIRFWKVIAVAQKQAGGNAGLAAFGFVLDQTGAIKKRGLEAFQVGEFKPFQQSLASISDLTGVEFPKILLDNDVMAGQAPIAVDSLGAVRTKK